MRGMAIRTAVVAVACVLLTTEPSASGGSIVQTLNLHLAAHATIFPSYNQLSPSLAPLNFVLYSITATGMSDNFKITNSSPDAFSFNLTATDRFVTDAGTFLSTQIFPFTIRGNGLLFFSYAINNGNPFVGSQGFPVGPGSQSLYVGTGFISPFFSGSGETVTADNSAISIAGTMEAPFITTTYDATETVIYFYGPTLGPAPEPSSIIILSLGLVPVVFVAWRRRGTDQVVHL